MGYWKEVAIRRMNGLPDDPDDEIVVGDIETYATLLGGEVEGDFIRCASPGRSSEDRSCYVRVDGPSRFFIYSCEGTQAAAYARLRQLLKLAPNKRSIDTGPFALRLLRETVPAPTTLVETYLKSRGLTGPIPICLRFHGQCLHSPTGGYRPAMMAERTNAIGNVIAVHRTYLRREGNGKADLTPVRMDLGPASGTAIRLSPLSDELMIGEGIETTLSAIQMFGLPGWAAGSAPMMNALELPATVRSVIILVDNDDAGDRAARHNAQRWLGEGRRVRKRHATVGNDFNDTLLARVSP